jgi:hypothetical protein
MSKEPIHAPEHYPLGQGAVGDTVLLITWRNRSAQILDQETWSTLQMRIKVMKITKVGIRNTHGYHLDIEVRANKKSKPVVVSPIRSNFGTGVASPSKTRPVVLILVPEEDQPDELRLWALSQRPNVVLVRNIGCDPPQIGLRCGKCLGELLIYIQTTEACELRWWRGGFSADDPEQVDSSGESLKCQDCETVYKMPKDVETS